MDASRNEARVALKLLERVATTGDPFDAISGAALDHDYVTGEVEALGARD